MKDFLVVVLGMLVLGGAVYCLLVLWAGIAFRAASRRSDSSFTPPVSLLKPLAGIEPGLERNLETFFQQDYPNFELLFAVSDPGDPALAVVERLREKHPAVPVTIQHVGASPYVNRKVYSVKQMADVSHSEFLIVSDSDAFVSRDYVRRVVASFADPRVGVVTCPYRGVAGKSLWSHLEALAMTTEFMPGVLVARAMEGMKFALGPTMAVRRSCLESIGGFNAMADYLADDFVLGHWAAQTGYKVVLSSCVINHQVVGESFWSNFLHRLRWARSTRFSRPWGYLGQAFTYPVPAALCLLALSPSSRLFQGVLLGALALRALVAWLVGWWVLSDRKILSDWWLVPFQDLLSFAVWCGGFTGRHVLWRNTTYLVERGGRFRRTPTPATGGD